MSQYHHDPTWLVRKLWDFCDLLRDDGLSYGDYLEQLTYLLFLKMAYEQAELLPVDDQVIPEWLDWDSLLSRSGPDLEDHYNRILKRLGGDGSMLGVIFRGARNRVQNPAKLKRLIKELIDKQDWLSLTTDVKGAAYEGLIEKTAQEGARGAGQYFTPRSLISAIVDVMHPVPLQRICDPACGTGGFFLGARQAILDRYPNLDPDETAHLQTRTFTGWEIAGLPARLCAMNLLLHGMANPDSESPIHVDDALRQAPHARFDMVLTNPPFGTSASEAYERDDFWVATKNKQLNFVQHVVSILKVDGAAAVVVPDNVLFEASKSGETIRRRLLHECEVHTLLRLPTGIFYAQGVKANVLFFDRRPGRSEPWTRELWVYDLRTNMHFTPKKRPLTRKHLDDFVACYQGGVRHQRVESERFKKFTYDQLMERDKVSLDLLWLRDKSVEDPDDLPPPEVILEEIVADLEEALAALHLLGNRR